MWPLSHRAVTPKKNPSSRSHLNHKEHRLKIKKKKRKKKHQNKVTLQYVCVCLCGSFPGWAVYLWKAPSQVSFRALPQEEIAFLQVPVPVPSPYSNLRQTLWVRTSVETAGGRKENEREWEFQKKKNNNKWRRACEALCMWDRNQQVLTYSASVGGS